LGVALAIADGGWELISVVDGTIKARSNDHKIVIISSLSDRHGQLIATGN
jgi:hypothetical protein